MKANIKKYTFECRFDRKYRCNSYRFVWKMKRANRRRFRREMNREAQSVEVE